MIEQANDLSRQVADVALQLFMTQGIKKTSMQEIAEHAGLSRMTVYRYYPDRRQATRAAFDRILQTFRSVITQSSGLEDVTQLAESLTVSLANLPRGNFVRLLEEFSRVYPEDFAVFEKERKQFFTTLVEKFLDRAEASGNLHHGLNRKVTIAYFETAVVNVLMNPALVGEDFSPEDVFATVKNIFLFGVFRSQEEK